MFGGIRDVVSKSSPWEITERPSDFRKDKVIDSSTPGELNSEQRNKHLKELERNYPLGPTRPGGPPAFYVGEVEGRKQLDFYDSFTYRKTRSWFTIGSFFVLAFYCMFRPGHDTDEWLDEYFDTPIWKQVPVIEQHVLKELIEEGKLRNLDTSQYEKRLEDVDKKVEEQRVQWQKWKWK